MDSVKRMYFSEMIDNSLKALMLRKKKQLLQDLDAASKEPLKMETHVLLNPTNEVNKVRQGVANLYPEIIFCRMILISYGTDSPLQGFIVHFDNGVGISSSESLRASFKYSDPTQKGLTMSVARFT